MIPSRTVEGIYPLKTLKAKWLDEHTWLCLNHLSSVRIPAAATSCWYTGCPSQRPDMPSTNTQHENAIAQVKATLERVRARAEENLRLQALISPPTHSHTNPTLVTVKCAVCKINIQRRASDVAKSKNGVFFCSRAHSAVNRPPIEVANAARLQRQTTHTTSPSPVAAVTVTGTSPVAAVKGRGSVIVQCGVCKQPLNRKPSDVKANRIGVFFCGRPHQEQWRREHS